MTTIDNARKRVATVLHEIDRLKQSEFPYHHPCDALDLLAEKFKRHQSILKKVSPDADTDTINNACSASLSEVRDYLPILGFILRSTNVRNAFEAYAPLQRLARSILRENTKLIVSSEWDFSPTVYRGMVGLDGFVLIGLPAPESANPLLIPLAGHELAHTVWTSNKISMHFINEIEDGVLKELKEKRWDDYRLLYPGFEKDDLTSDNLLARPTWILSLTLALLHTEEIFCDLFGLRLFAESYIHAFAYLLFPGFSGKRLLQYPKLKQRASYLVNAANKMGITVPSEFEAGCVAEDDPEESDRKLLVSVADVVSASLFSKIEAQVKDFIADKPIPVRDNDKVELISKEFRERVAPMSIESSLTDLINAGWLCMLDADLWNKDDFPQIRPEEKDRVLKDLILKSMEVSEIYNRLSKPKVA